VKKIKLIDDTFNTHKYNPHQKFPYLTVFFYAPKIEDLPNPRSIGDILYLRRYAFCNTDSLSVNTTIVSRDITLKLNTALGPCLKVIPILLKLRSIRRLVLVWTSASRNTKI
jgi:hypothetical protein